MAKGRLIIKEASYSKQIWVQMDEFSALVFYAAIPHLESDGTLPRDPERLKLIICPLSSRPIEKFEKTIICWLKTRPALVLERKLKGSPVLYFTDFIRSQMGLSHANPPVFDDDKTAIISRKSRGSRISIEVKGSEVKGREVKKEIKDIKPSALDTPKERTPIQNIIRSYMVSREIDPDDKSWWKTNGGRAARAAKAVFEAFGNEKTAMQYVIIKADDFKEKGLDYTLETIARHAHDHKGELNVTLNAGKKPQTAMVPNPVPPAGRLGGPTQQGETSAIGKKERFDKLASGVLRALPHIGTNES